MNERTEKEKAEEVALLDDHKSRRANIIARHYHDLLDEDERYADAVRELFARKAKNQP